MQYKVVKNLDVKKLTFKIFRIIYVENENISLRFNVNVKMQYNNKTRLKSWRTKNYIQILRLRYVENEQYFSQIQRKRKNAK